MDYGHYANAESLSILKEHFDGIVTVLENKLRHFQQQFFLPKQFYLFGFCFGGQIVLQAGRSFGYRLIEQIDGKHNKFFA